MKSVLILFMTILTNKQICESANILVYIQMPLYSHQTAFRPVWRELANRGHKITLITSEPMTDHENITQINLSGVHDIMERYNYYKRISTESLSINMMRLVLNLFLEILEYQVTHPEVQRILRQEKQFDLLISEFLMPSIAAAVSNRLKVPLIGVSSLDGNYLSHMAVGNPNNPVVYPSYDMPFKSEPTLIERLKSTLFVVFQRSLNNVYTSLGIDKVLIKYFDEPSASLEPAVRGISLYLVNANPIFCSQRPLTPQTVNIGGFVHINKPQPLPRRLQDYLDNATEGCIYFSLGSHLRSSKLSKEKIQLYLKVFEEIPYKILWKFEDTLDEKPNNVCIEKWLPQQDVLRHKNVKLFITQGGLQSVEEAIFYHVPMIGVPFLGDQYNNVNKIIDKGMGLGVDHTTLTIEILRDSILEVMRNPKYRDNVKFQAELVLDQPMTAVEKAVWWTEYILRHKGGQHLRNPGIDLPFYQQYLLDVILIFALTVLGVICTIYVFLRMLSNILHYFITSKRKLKTC